MKLQKPRVKQDLDELQCWVFERLLYAALLIPFLVILITTLSYLLLSSSQQLHEYTMALDSRPMELVEVKCILHRLSIFAYGFNLCLILFALGTTPLLFSAPARECTLIEGCATTKSIVWSGMRDFQILNVIGIDDSDAPDEGFSSEDLLMDFEEDGE